MKHAFLILAHDEVDLLKLLVGSLDDPRNDIYVHMDAGNFPPCMLSMPVWSCWKRGRM